MKNMQTTKIVVGSVSMSVGVYPIPQKIKPTINLLCPQCKQRINYDIVCHNCKKKFQRAQLKAGFEYEKNKFVELSRNELKAVSEPVIEVLTLVSKGSEDFEYLLQSGKHYYLSPSDKKKSKIFRLFYEKLLRGDLAAIVKYYLRNVEYFGYIEAGKGVLILHSCYFEAEIRDCPAELKPEEVELTDEERDAFHLYMQDNFYHSKDYVEVAEPEQVARLKRIIEARIKGEPMPEVKREETTSEEDIFLKNLIKRKLHPTLNANEVVSK